MPRQQTCGIPHNALCHVCCAALLLTMPVLVLAESPGSASNSSIGFAAYVPRSAKLFITARRLREVDRALHRAHAWRLLPLLVGDAETKQPVDLRSAIAGFLGLSNPKTIDEILRTEAALVVPSWSRLGSAVWLVRLPHESVVDRWFPLSRRTSTATVGDALLFRTSDGVMVCVRDRILAMGRRWGGDSSLSAVVARMTGRGGDVLSNSAVYQELMGSLAEDPLAVLYVGERDQQDGVAAAQHFLWPQFGQAVLGLYGGDGRLDVVIRGQGTASPRRSRLRSSTIKRLFELPHTTLLASAVAVDLNQPKSRGLSSPLGDRLARYLAAFESLQPAVDGGASAVGQLGPDVILAWGQDLRENLSAPQLAVLLECSDPQTVLDMTRRTAERILQLVSALNLVPDSDTPVVKQTRHVSAPVFHVPLAGLAGEGSSSLLKLLENVEPAWTVWDGWLIVALSREHLQHILDASLSLVPTLAAVRDVRSLRRRAHGAVAALSILQPDLAGDVLDNWVEDFEAGSTSFLEAVWWGGRAPSGVELDWPLGMAFMEETDLGAVTIAEVDPEGPVHGRLKPGDRIVGVDGRLLSMNSPTADLKNRWAASTDVAGAALRIVRGEEMLEVTVPSPSSAARNSAQQTEPARALSEISSLGRTLEFVTLDVEASERSRYSARLSLRFAPARAPHSSEVR